MIFSLKLLGGNPSYKRAKPEEPVTTDIVKAFLATVNFPFLNERSIQRQMLPIDFSPEILHKAMLLLHLKVLGGIEGSVRIEVPGVKKYLCTVVSDEQVVE